MSDAIAEVVSGRPVHIETVEVEPVRVRMFADGRMSRQNAAKYIGYAPKTLTMWAMEGKGPRVHKIAGRCFYYKADLDNFVQGKAA